MPGFLWFRIFLEDDMPVLEKKRSVKAATIYEVAKLAGVSPVTVARAYNKRLPVAEDTHKKIRDAAEQLNFKPNPLARGLKGGRTSSIAIIWILGFPLLPEAVFFELMAKARSKGFHLQYIGCRGDVESINESLNECAVRGIDAVAVCANSEDLNEASMALLRKFSASLIIGSTALQADIDQIIWDRTRAIDEMLMHFKSRGRKKPGILMYIDKSNQVKLDAFMQYSFRNGFSIESSSIIDTGIASNNIEEHERFFDNYLRQNKFNLDALLCASDEMACIAVSKLIEHGFKVPEDVAVVGFNNSPISRVFSPKIATVDRCHGDLGNTIQKMLFARMENKDMPVQINRVDMHFLCRASAGV